MLDQAKPQSTVAIAVCLAVHIDIGRCEHGGTAEHGQRITKAAVVRVNVREIEQKVSRPRL